MYHRAEFKIADAMHAFLALCHPDKYGMEGADPMTLAEFNANAKRRPAAWEPFREYAEKNLK